MKNKKLNFAICGLLSLLMLAVTVWFLCVWIPTIDVKQYVWQIVSAFGFVVLLLLLTIILFYNTTSHSAKFAAKKGFNTTLSILLAVTAVAAVAFGVMQIVHYYTVNKAITQTLFYGIVSLVAGLATLIVAILIKRKNVKIVTTENKLKDFEKGPKKPETFNDKKINKTCEFCGCHLSKTDNNCPNCGSKIK